MALAIAILCGLVSASPANAEPGGPAPVKVWLGCGLTKDTRPSSVCPAGKKIGAFFKDSVETTYTVCVKFPNGRRLCARDQLAEAGIVQVNAITPGGVGIYKVTWTVGGKSYSASIRSGRS